MAAEILMAKVRQCVKDLATLATIMQKSPDNEKKYAEIKNLVLEVLGTLVADTPNEEAVEEACANLKEASQEYNDAGDNLNIKKAASSFASRVGSIKPADYHAFCEALIQEDKDKALKYLSEEPTTLTAEEPITLTAEELTQLAWQCYQEQRYNEAFDYALQATHEHSLNAYYLLGSLYSSGLGTKKDVHKAYEVFLEGANREDGACQFMVYVSLLTGTGVQKNLEEAYVWLAKSAYNQYPLGMREYAKGYIQIRNYQEAYNYFVKAANAGDDESKAWIGYCYENGYGVQRDIYRAKSIYQEEISKGNEQAKIFYDSLLKSERETGTGRKQYENQRKQAAEQVRVGQNENTEKKKRGKGCLIFAFILLLIAGYLGYQFWYKDYAKDNAAPHSYVFATNLFLRSSKEANVDNNQLGMIPYGTELVVYSDDGEWAYVKANGEKGYVASDYLLNAEDFALLNGVWGNEDAKEVVETSRCRLAILNYLKSNNLKTGETGWQLFAKQKEMKPNSVLFPSLNDGYGNYAKFAFILKNNVTGQRKLVLYAFEEDETPIFRYEEDAPESGNIKSVAYTKWNDQYRVTYSKKNITYTPPIQQQTEQETKPFIIRSVEFANTDYDGNILTGFGKQLYTDVQYLKPRISYKKQNSASERLTFKVKILRPDGTLERSSSSPAGYTFEHTVNVWGGNGMCELTGWGNREGSAYQAGRYHYEIWHEEEMLYSTTIDIKKKEVVAPLSISSVAFANVNYNEYVLRNYGSQLYSDTQYLRAKVFYQKPTASTESFKLKVKIFNPDGSLSRGGGSPAGYTFETQLLLSGKEGSFFLTGWGNKEGTLYTAGNYRYEIWLDGTKLLYATMVNIKEKP